MISFAQIPTTALSLSTDPTAASVNRSISFRPMLTSHPRTEETTRESAPSQSLEVLYPSLYAERPSLSGRCAAAFRAIVAMISAGRRPAREAQMSDAVAGRLMSTGR
jgi:hypothetical protein